MEENEDQGVPLQEVFSETQRYGRVARYELRQPSRFGQAAAAVSGLGEDRSSPRRVPDFSVVRKISFEFVNAIILIISRI